jgi:type VI secretion system protein
MPLLLRVRLTNRRDDDPPEQLVEIDARLSVGRGQDNDLVLQDTDQRLSRTHCVIERQTRQYVVIDKSTNGTFLNDERNRLPRDIATPLKADDHLHVGPFDLKVVSVITPETGGADQRVGEDASEPGSLGPVSNQPGAEQPSEQPGRAIGRRDPLASGVLDGLDGESLPEAFDFRPNASPVAAQPDHTPVEADVFVRPQLRTEPIPADWDPMAEFGVAARVPAPEAPGSEPAPPQSVARPDPAQSIISGPDGAADVAQPAVDIPDSATNGLHSTDQRLMAAFLTGCGLADATLTAPQAEQLLASAGRMLRISIDGLLQILSARSVTKQEFQVERTMISRGANNPLKFVTSVDEALRALLLTRIPGFLTPDQAVGEAVTDIQTHQIGVLSGMQAALCTILKQFDPANLEHEPDRRSLYELVRVLRKARAWDRFEARYRRLSQTLEEDALGAFGAEFARAYQAQTSGAHDPAKHFTNSRRRAASQGDSHAN